MRRGLTLLEVLLTAIIAVVLLGLTAQGIMRGSEITRLVTTQQELLEDVRSAGAFLSDQLAQAVYVYPPNTTITLGRVGDYWATKPNSTSNNWVIGADPMLAFILPPADPTLGNECIAGSTNPDAAEGCLRFVAFYALERTKVLSSAPPDIRPENNAKSNENWVLYYFSCSMLTTECGNGPDNTPPEITRDATDMPSTFAPAQGGPEGQFLADYINPPAWSTSYRCAMNGAKATLDGKCKDNPTLSPLDSASTIELTLQSRVTRGDRATSVPNPALTIRSTARNLLLR